MSYGVLVIEDDAVLNRVLVDKFRRLGWRAFPILQSQELVQVLQEEVFFSHAVLDINLMHHNGLSLIPDILAHSPMCKIVVLTGYASVQATVDAIKLGAVNVVPKPSPFQTLLDAFGHVPSTEKISPDIRPQGLNAAEWETIQKALADYDFNISKTAEALGMHRRTLQRKLKKRIW